MTASVALTLFRRVRGGLEPGQQFADAPLSKRAMHTISDYYQNQASGYLVEKSIASPLPTVQLKDPSLADVGDVLRQLGADLQNGLTLQDARRRLSQDGPNELLAKPQTPVWRRMWSHFQDPLIYLLLVAMVVALAAWFVEGRRGLPVDAIVIALIVVLNGILGFVQEARAQNAVAALARMTAITSSVLRDGHVVRVPSDQLVRGDMLVLSEGDAVGADARLVEAAALRVQEASLTGESAVVTKDFATLKQSVPLGDRLNMVFKGTNVAQGTARAVVTATAMNTEMGAIARMLQAAKEEPTPLEQEVGRLGRMLGLAVIVITAVVVGTILAISDIQNSAELMRVLLLGVSLAVAAVPEGLPAVLSVVLALGVQRMAKHNAIVKKLSSVETLGSATVIASDKTGTLTRAEMTIVRVMTASGSTEVTGVGYAPVGRVELAGMPLTTSGALHAEQLVLLSGGSLAGNAELRQSKSGAWEIHGDPTEAAFLVAEQKLGLTLRREKRFERIAEIPFTSERKMMSVLARDHEHGDQTVLIAKGAPDVLLGCCSHVRVGMETPLLDATHRARILTEVGQLTNQALRTLSVAYRPLLVGECADATESLERALIFVGTVGIIDPPRTEVAVAIQEAHRAGIRVIMITGDHPQTAVRIATDLGIVEPGAASLSGAQLDVLSDADFRAAVHQTSVYARVMPAHKLRIVDALQADGNIVAMTGDGVNDAPALKSADIGIAMGVTGTEVTKEAAKMILADDNFATIVQAVREGRGILDNIRKFLRYLLSSNMGEVLTVFLGVVLAGVIGLGDSGGTSGVVVLPLLATQILWINLITDSWPALAMGVDPPTDDVMARKPRQVNERLIDGRMWSGVIQIGVVVALVTLMTMDIFLPGGLVEGSQDLATARTAGFTVLVMAHLFNAFNARSETASAFSHFFSNPWLLGALALSLLLQVAVVNVGFLNLAFGTVPLELHQWVLCTAMASVVLWYSELRKFAVRILNR